MNLIFITEARYLKAKDGNIYSITNSYSYFLFERYLKHFDKVFIIARVGYGEITEDLIGNIITKNEKIEVLELPYYVGPYGFLKQYLKIKWKMSSYIKKIDIENSCIICRVPGRMGTIAISYLKRHKIPYGIEVIADPYDGLTKGSIDNFFRPIIRIIAYLTLKRIAWSAPAALYVTNSTLQKRYPCKNFSIGVSSVFLPNEAFVSTPKRILSSEIKLIAVGSLHQMYKSPDVVIDALQILKRNGYVFHLIWLGDGKYMNEMILRTTENGLGNDIEFLGNISAGQAIRDKLDESDILLMPSRTEGLPRAMVEAMARALPCIGTPIGGIPELLDKSALIPINDPVSLANKIIFMIENQEYTYSQSIRNLNKALEYSELILDKKRLSYFDYLKSFNQTKI